MIACGTGYECPAGETCEFLKVVDVESQFNPAYTSHHAVLGPAYGPGSTPLTTAPGGALANQVFGTDANSDPITWESTLNCEDCHYGTATNKLQAHGTANARYLLRDKDGGDTDAAGLNVNCLRCHISTGDPASYDESLSAFTEHVVGQHVDDTLTLFGISCLNCHGGAEFGGIHGVDGLVTDDDGGGDYEPYVFTWGRNSVSFPRQTAPTTAPKALGTSSG